MTHKPHLLGLPRRGCRCPYLCHNVIRKIWRSLSVTFNLSISTAMPCPHAQFRAESNRFAASESLSTYLASIPGCPECDLLLRVVEDFRPGWIDENKNGQGSIDVVYKVGSRHDGVPATVNLLVSPLCQGHSWFEGRKLVDSFQFFRRSRGMIFNPTLDLRKWHPVRRVQHSRCKVWTSLTWSVCRRTNVRTHVRAML